MTTDIILGGINLQTVCDMKTSMKKDAVKFVAEGVERVGNLIAEIKDSSDPHEIDSKASLALEILKNVELVSNVTGSLYTVPWDSEGDGTWSSEIEGKQYSDGNTFDSPFLGKLYNQLDNMEYDARKWYASTC